MKRIFILFILLPSLVLADFDLNHTLFDELLKKHVKNGLVNYKELKLEEAKLSKYNKSLAKLSFSEYQDFTKDQQLSFLINAYNSHMLWAVVKSYPIDSPKEIQFQNTDVWNYSFVNLIEKKISLNFLENEIIRKNFDEPGIHFVINCAAMSCPPLQAFALTAENLEKTLSQSASDFMYNKKFNFFNPQTNQVFISQIFNWYSEDFKINPNASILSYIKQFYPEVNSQTKVSFLEYNWQLNQQAN